MRRFLVAATLVVALVAIFLGVVTNQAVADDVGLNVIVEFDYSGDDGAKCGYFGKGDGSEFPDAAQVIISDAAGITVGVVNLRDGLDALYNDEGLPGIVVGEFCRVSSDLTLPDSTFYTFAVRGHFEWTVARSDLEARNWSMPIVFLATG